MPRKPLESLGAAVRAQRGQRKLRDVAREIGIGTATLMRVESGRIPDVATFGKLCIWLQIEPGTFLGFDPGQRTPTPSTTGLPAPVFVSAHLRADQTPNHDTVQALAQMLLLAAKAQQRASHELRDGDA